MGIFRLRWIRRAVLLALVPTAIVLAETEKERHPVEVAPRAEAARIDAGVQPAIVQSPAQQKAAAQLEAKKKAREVAAAARKEAAEMKEHAAEEEGASRAAAAQQQKEAADAAKAARLARMRKAMAEEAKRSPSGEKTDAGP